MRFKLFYFIIISLSITQVSCLSPKLKARNLSGTGAATSSPLYNFKTWIAQMGLGFPGITSSAGDDYLVAVANDIYGNTYFTGYTTGNIAGTAAVGPNDVYVGKLDVSGNLLWIHSLTPAYSALIPGSNGNDYPAAMSVDLAGNIYVGGYASGPLGGVYEGVFDAWVTKIDTAGNLLWIHSLVPSYSGLILNATQDDSIRGVSFDSSGNVYVTGTTSGNLAVANGGAFDTFIAKIDSAGNLLWIKQFTTAYSGLISSALGIDIAYSIVTSSTGDSYICGGTDGSFAAVNGGVVDAFVAKVDTSGNLSWIKQLTTAYSPLIITAAGTERAYGVSLNYAGDLLHVTGNTDNNLTAPSGGSFDAVTAQINVTTGDLIWINQLTPAFSPLISSAVNIDRAFSISNDAAGNSYIVGETQSNLVTAVGGLSDGFVAKFNSSGNLIWVKQLSPTYSSLISSTAASDVLVGVSTDASGHSSMVGHTASAMSGTHGGGLADGFIVHIDVDGNL